MILCLDKMAVDIRFNKNILDIGVLEMLGKVEVVI
jgi:hypothetical protein